MHFKTKLQSALHSWTRIKTFKDCSEAEKVIH